MGVSRDTFYHYQELAEDGNLDLLINNNRRVLNVKNRVDLEIEQVAIAYAIEQLTHG